MEKRRGSNLTSGYSRTLGKKGPAKEMIKRTSSKGKQTRVDITSRAAGRLIKMPTRMDHRFGEVEVIGDSAEGEQ